MFPLFRAVLAGGLLLVVIGRADSMPDAPNAPVVMGTNAPLLMRAADLPFPIGE